MKKNKIIILIILLFLIIAISFTIYKSNFFNTKTKETFKEISQNEIAAKEEVKEEPNELIVVVLNRKPKQEIQQETPNNAQIDNSENQTANKQVENKVVKTNNVADTNQEISTASYYIKVNYKANVVTVYSKDETGNYTVPCKAMTCSTGTATPTSGKYKIDFKYRWLGLIGGVYGQYCTRIVDNILFHSVPYLTNGDSGSLEYWEYDKLGTTASAGCVRLTVVDAKWIYDNCESGTKVEFYADEEPGPLGKPDTMKISDYEGYRNWDPTDTNGDNPWANF